MIKYIKILQHIRGKGRVLHYFCFSVTFVILMFASLAFGEVITDGTMGRAEEISGPRYTISPDHGRQAGNNLFHSFKTFNVGENEGATFSGPDSIRNVISRVTGGSESIIDGNISCTIPGSDFYFLNPSGVIFGKNASLNIQGSFHVSTADYLRLNEDLFDAKPSGSELISSAPPEAFGFMDAGQTSIIIRSGQDQDAPSTGKGLSVSKGNTISIIGGNIVMEEGSSLTAPSGNIFMAGVKSQGEVEITQSALHVTSQKGGDVTLLKNSSLDVSGDPAGSIHIHGGRVVLDNAEIRSENLGQDSWLDSEGDLYEGDLYEGDLYEGDLYEDDMYVEIPGDPYENNLEEGDFDEADLGDDFASFPWQIGINADSLLLKAGTTISSGTKGRGWAGSIGIWANNSIRLEEKSSISTASQGQGDAGFIILTAPHVILDGASGITSESIAAAAGGDAGSIEIFDCDLLRVENGSSISTATWGEGLAGGILVDAKDIILSENASISSSSWSRGESGDAGFIHFEVADTIELSQGSTITTSSKGQGSAGYIAINSKEVILDGSTSISSTNVLGSNGNTSASLPPGVGMDFTTPEGANQPGFIGIHARDHILMDHNSSINTSTSGTGTAGDIYIETAALDIQGNSSLLSSSSAAADGGSAGTISIEAHDTVSLKQGSVVATEAASGGRGLISMEAGNLVEMEKSRVSTDVKSGAGQSGDLHIQSSRVVVNQGDISARADQGAGGSILITSDLYLGSTDSIVTASSRLGIDGEVEIESIEPDLPLNMPIMPSGFLDITHWAKTPCHARSGENISSFVVYTMDAAPWDPGDWQPAPFSFFPLPGTTDPVTNKKILPNSLAWKIPCDCSTLSRISGDWY